MNDQVKETSIEGDLECLPSVLRVFARAFQAGFGEPEIQKLVGAGEQLDSGRRYRSHFTIEADGTLERLSVELTVEEVSSIQIRMESSAKIIHAVEKLLPEALSVAAADSVEPDASGAEELAKRRQQILAESAAAAQPIIDSLQKAGFDVQSLGELKESEYYRRAVPTLIEWLERTLHSGTKFALLGLILKSGVRPMPYGKLLAAWEETSDLTDYDHSFKWQMASMLERIADKLPIDDLLRVVKDKRQGKTREMLVIGLGRVKDPRAVSSLVYLLRNGDLVAHALEGMRKHNVPEAIPVVEQYIKSDNALIRREAKKTLLKLGKVRNSSA